jgi:hypothetical protein
LNLHPMVGRYKRYAVRAERLVSQRLAFFSYFFSFSMAHYAARWETSAREVSPRRWPDRDSWCQALLRASYTLPERACASDLAPA